MGGERPLTGSSAGRRRAAALTSCLTLLALAGVSQAAPQPKCKPAQNGAWTQLAAPRFPAGAAAMTGFAVSSTGRAVYATNSRVVVRTNDQGCTWRAVYTATDSPTGTDSITRVITPPTGGADTVMLAVETAVGAVQPQPTTAIVGSTNAGTSWSAKGQPLPGELIDGAASGGTSKDTLYLLLRQTPIDDVITGAHVQGGIVVARTDDAGASWAVGAQQTNGPSLSGGGAGADSTTPQFTEVVADPTNGKHAWFADPTGLYVTTDGGETTALASQATTLGAEHLAASVNSKNQVQVAFGFITSTRPSVGYSRPDSKKFHTDTYAAAQLPAKITSLVSGLRPGEFIAATASGVALHRPPTGFELPLTDVSPKKARLTELQAVRAGKEITVYGRSGSTILFRQMPPPKPPVKLVGPGGKPISKADLSYRPPKGFKIGAPNIDPNNIRLTLPVGSQQELPYTLSLPGSRKVDVFMLVDTSGSMKDTIEATKSGLDKIIDGFAQAHVDAWFGLGQYRTYDVGPAYERLMDVGEYSPRFTAALKGLQASGGGNDKTQLDALYQVATGEGLSSGTAFIAAGQQAHWRPDALRIVLHLTDEAFVTGGTHPSAVKVAAALKRVKATQIGVGFQCEEGDTQCQGTSLIDPTNPGGTPNPNTIGDGPADGLIDMARKTGAVAPPEGADCDGDNQPDLLPGEPLVCVIPPARASESAVMARAIVNTVLATPDFAPVSVTWEATQPVVAQVTPKVAPGVNLRFPAALTFQVTYACPAQLPAGTGHLATLTARVRSLVVAVARAEVDCIAPPGPLVHVPPAVAAGVVTIPNPPPNPVNQPNPQSQPQSQPQTQSQAQAQAGAAYQEQQEVQMAFAYMNPGEAPQTEGETTYLFSAYRPSPQQDPTLAWLGAGAAGMTAVAAGTLWLSRRRTQTVPVRRSPR